MVQFGAHQKIGAQSEGLKNFRGNLVRVGAIWCAVMKLRLLEAIWCGPVGAVWCAHNYLVRVGAIWCVSHRFGAVWCAPNCTNTHQLTARDV